MTDVRRRRRRTARRVTARMTVAMIGSNVLGAAVVFVYLVFVIPPRPTDSAVLTLVNTVVAAGGRGGEEGDRVVVEAAAHRGCLLYTSPSPRDRTRSRMPSSA